MRYVTASAVGLAAALVAATLWVVGSVFVPIYGSMLVARFTGEGGAVGAVVGSGSVLLVAAIAFAGGFFWSMRRTKRRTAAGRVHGP